MTTPRRPQVHQVLASLGYGDAVHLTQPARPAAELADQTLTVLSHRHRVVADMLAEIEAIEGCRADAPGTGGDATFNPCRGRPLRRQPVVRQVPAHPIKASRS